MKKLLVVLVLLAGGVGYFGIAVFGPEHDVLVRLEEDAKREWAQVDTLLVRRNDLVSNIVAVVQQSATNEKEILENASAALAGYRSAGTDPSDRIPAAQAADRAAFQIMSVGRAYPDVKSNANFDRLVSELVKTEDAIAAQRMTYNKAVSALNSEVKSVRGMMTTMLDGTQAGVYYDPPKDALLPPVVTSGAAGLETSKAEAPRTSRALETLKLKGVVESEGRAVAMLQYPNGRTINVTTGEAILELNAKVKNIAVDNVTFEERTVGADGAATVRVVEVGR